MNIIHIKNIRFKNGKNIKIRKWSKLYEVKRKYPKRFNIYYKVILFMILLLYFLAISIIKGSFKIKKYFISQKDYDLTAEKIYTIQLDI